MTAAAYVLDANVFIEASRRYYAFDLAPGFWKSLIRYTESGQIISIDRVKKEIERGKDELALWVKQDFHHAFISTNDKNIIAAYRKIITWVNAQSQFSEAAKAEFAQGADGWLAACATANNYIVVTHEVVKPEIRRQVPIPNVCQAFDVKFVDTFEMLRELKIKFL